MNKKYIPGFAFILCLFNQPLQAENWTTVLAEDPLSGSMACLMVSSSQVIKDGQSSTDVHFVYNGQVFIAKTKSNIDLSYETTGLQIDEQNLFNIDRLHNKSNVVFESQADEIRQEFINGLKAKLTLGFWPSWPKTNSFSTHFDLRGFTKSYNALVSCQVSGKLN